MLLNIGPKPDGSVAKWQAAMMGRIGEWVKKHSEAIYGCGGEWSKPLNPGLGPWRTTRRGSTLYMHLVRYPGQEFSLANLHDYYLKSATLLDTGQKLKIIHEPTRDIIRGLPKKSPDPIAAVIKFSTRPKTAAEKRKRKGIGLDDPEKEICYC